MTTTARRAGRGWWLVLLLIVLAGLVGRAWNLDFDDRHHLHPDERHWALTSAALAADEPPPRHGTVAGPLLDWLDGDRSPANPYRVTTSFVYGPATLAMGRAVAGWLHDGATTGAQPASFVVSALDRLGIPLLDDDGAARFDDAYQVDLVGRLLGVALDTLAIVVVALAGRRLGGRAVGLAAAGVHAAAVLAIQHTHYFGSEPALSLSAATLLLAALCADRSADRRRARRGGLAVGVAAGATVAVKLSGAGAALVALGALAALAVRHRRRADVVRFATALLAAGVTVRVLLPAAFVGLGLRPSQRFLDDLRTTGAAAIADMPPAIQWAGRVPLLEVGGWLLRSTIGPGTAVAAVFGAVALVRGRRAIGGYAVAVVLGTIAVSMLLVVRGPVTSGRYFVSLLPALAVAAGYGAVALWTWQRALGSWRRIVATAALALCAAAVVVWPLAFVAGVHGHEHTRIAASRWIAEHVPPGATLSSQTWDDALPLLVPGVDPAAYQRVELHLWGVDSMEKIAVLAEQLAGTDYVVESSPRVWNSVVRLPERYPSTITLFQALDDGRLGFERVATFASPPRLGPLRLDSNAVEEAFSVYDHPEVRIWQRVEDVGAEVIFDILDPRAATDAVWVSPAQATTHGGRLTAAERAANAAAPTFDDAFAGSGIAGSAVVQLSGWIALVTLVSIAAWVLAAPVLGRLPDAGAGIAPTLGLVGVVAATVLLAGGAGLALTNALVASLVAALLVAAGLVAWRRRATLRTRWRAQRATVITAAAVTAAGGALALVVRLFNANLWHRAQGGEKPFELAMLTSVLRSRTLPPPDLWFSGGALNYYYGGSLLIATPARVLRTTPDLALNLGIGLVGALAAGAAYSIGVAVWSVGAHMRAGTRRSVGSARGDERRAGVLAAVFVMMVPNVQTVVDAVRHLASAGRGAFDWWAPSRVVRGSPVITEFPAWTLAFGDLHAHLLGLPVMLTLGTVLCACALLIGTGPRPSTATLCGAGALVGLTVGAVRFVNTWDVPVAALLVLVTAAAIAARAARRRELWRGVGAAVGCSVIALVVPWLPFTRRFIVDDFGLDPVIDPTPLRGLLAQFGLWAAISTLVVALSVGPVLADRLRRPTTRLAVTAVFISLVGVIVAAALAGRLALAAALVLAVGSGGGVLIIARHDAALGDEGAAREWSRPLPLRSGVAGAGALTCLALGWSVIAVIEVVSIAEGVARVNTVFKGWFQAWWLLAVGCAVAVVMLLADRGRTLARVLGRVAVAVGVVMASAFAAVLVPARLESREGPAAVGLDGTAFLRAGIVLQDNGVSFDPGDDLPLIEWLRSNVAGFPTIVEAPGRGYTWTARMAAHAGLPTVIGWPYHQSQQRPGDGAEISERIADVTALYTDPAEVSAALGVLWRYDAAYIVFGTAERVLTGDDTATAAALRALPCTDEVFADGWRFVLAVDQSCVASAVLPVPGQITN